MAIQDSHRDGHRNGHRNRNALHAQVDVNLRVPRDAAGDLPAGVREVLANVDGVAAVEAVEVAGVRPTSFDLRVDATAALRLGRDDFEGESHDTPDAVRDHLEDGFGIERVEALVLDYG